MLHFESERRSIDIGPAQFVPVQLNRLIFLTVLWKISTWFELLEYLTLLDFLISSTEGSEPVGYYVNTPIDGNLLYWKPIYLILQKTSQIIDPTNLSLCFVLYCNWVFLPLWILSSNKFYFLKPIEYIEIKRFDWYYLLHIDFSKGC